jgi:hypothetical protein
VPRKVILALAILLDDIRGTDRLIGRELFLSGRASLPFKVGTVVKTGPRNRFCALGRGIHFRFLTFLDERNKIPVGSSDIDLRMGGGAVGGFGAADDNLCESGGGDRESG